MVIAYIKIMFRESDVHTESRFFLFMNEWLEKHGIMRNQFQEANFQYSSFSRIDRNSSFSSATSLYHLLTIVKNPIKIVG